MYKFNEHFKGIQVLKSKCKKCLEQVSGAKPG